MIRLIVLIITITLTANAQDAELRKMANTTFQPKAWLIPVKNHDFTVKKGTRVKFTVTLTNSGNEEYELQKATPLFAYYMEKSTEKPFDYKLENISQEKLCEIQLKTLSNRLKSVRDMEEKKAVQYAEKLNLQNVDSKDKFINHLNQKITKIRENQTKVIEFDKKSIVKPGAILTFSGSGYLPEITQKDLKSCNLTLKIFTKEGKHISVPVEAVFY